MSVFTSQIRNKPWVWQVTLLCLLFGGLLASALKAQDRTRAAKLPTTRLPALAAAYSEQRDTIAEQTKKIAELQRNLAKYQKAANESDEVVPLLKADLEKATVLSGQTAVVGPGVVVTLRDAKNMPPKPNDVSPDEWNAIAKQYAIHDQDIISVVNELRAAGAEAISINDQRVIATTAVRCTGPVVNVNGIATGVPIRIKAIGDAETLHSSMLMPNGIADQYKITDSSMFSIEKNDHLTLPAFAGANPLRFAKKASDATAEQAQKQSEAATKSANPDGTTTAQ